MAAEINSARKKRGAYKSAQQRRTKTIRVMATEEQWEKLKAASGAQGMSLSSWLLGIGLAAAEKSR